MTKDAENAIGAQMRRLQVSGKVDGMIDDEGDLWQATTTVFVGKQI